MEKNNSNERAKKPDLDETVVVSELHDDLKRKAAAAAREGRLRENGTEPVSMWIFLVSGIALLIGGAVLGKNGGNFEYDQLVAEGYKRADAPGDTGPEQLTGEALAVYMKKGATIYSSKCGGCHQANGQGAAGAYPPLAGSEWVTGSTGQLAAIILHGLRGPIQVAGTTWNGNMPAQKSGLMAEDVAGVMTYIRNSFGNSTGDVISLEMGQAALDASDAYGSDQMTVDVLKAQFDKPLPGDALAPNTMIDMVTLEPIEDGA